jgi:hypothetical protein
LLIPCSHLLEGITFVIKGCGEGWIRGFVGDALQGSSPVASRRESLQGVASSLAWPPWSVSSHRRSRAISLKWRTPQSTRGLISFITHTCCKPAVMKFDCAGLSACCLRYLRLSRAWMGGRYPSIDAQPASGSWFSAAAACGGVPTFISRLLRCCGRGSGGCATLWSGQRRRLDHVRRTRLSPFARPVWGESNSIPRIHSLNCLRIGSKLKRPALSSTGFCNS